MNRSLGIYNLVDKDSISDSIKRVVDGENDFNIYLSPKGLSELRKKIAEFLYNSWKYEVNYKNMLITNGSQQSMNLIVDSLLNENDVVFVEQPTYFGAIDILKKRKLKLIGIELTEDGFDLNELEDKIKKCKPRMIYVTPTFNNPTGYSWSNKKRKEFLKIINKYNIIIVEDDPYSYLNFANVSYKSLYELNEGINIIYLGTFSKIISPSINVGYIICAEVYMNAIYVYKKSYDLCTSAFIQYVVLDYLSNNDIMNLINLKVLNYKALLERSMAIIKKESGKNMISYTKSKGGMFYVVRFKSEVNYELYENLNNYYLDGDHSCEARINICSFDKFYLGDY